MILPLLSTLLAVSLGPIASEPAREPQLAVNGSTVAMTFGAGNAIYFAASHDSGKTFSAPVKVTEAAVIPLNRHRGPRIAVSGKTIVVSAVTGRTLSHEQHAHGLPSDGDLTVWRSLDGGKTWSKGVVVNDIPGAPTEGLHSLAVGPEGRLFAAWLDKRLDKRTGSGTKLYGASSTDGGATWSKNVLIYQSPSGSICECCHPSVAINAAGEVSVMWRNSLNGSRDMYVGHSRDGVSFSAPEKLGTGSWHLNGCPMDGGAIALAGNRLITAWRRGESIYLDEPGKPEKEIGVGKDVAMTVVNGRTYSIWTAASGTMLWREGKLERVADSGAFPAIAGLPDGSVVCAWEANGAIVVNRIDPPH
jgi:hypothetical protein